MAQNDAPIIIIGAGLSGLLLGQALQNKASIPFIIFEKEPLPILGSITGKSSHDRSWTLAIHWALPHLEEILPANLFSRLAADAYCNPHEAPSSDQTISLFNSATGELLKRVPSPGLIRVDKARMTNLCMQGIEKSIKVGMLLKSITYDESNAGVIEAIFEKKNGLGEEEEKRAKGRMIIGADGARSMVRKFLVGEVEAELQPANIVSMMATVKYGDRKTAEMIKSTNGSFYMGFHPDGIKNFVSVQTVPDPNNPSTWSFSVSNSWEGNPSSSQYATHESRLAAMKIAAKNCVEPFRSSILSVPDGTQVPPNRIGYWVPRTWDNRGGRVTLIGDAAHPMTPDRGQALNHCILDVKNLAIALKSVGREDTKAQQEEIALYEEEMIPRAAAEVESSIENTKMSHDWERLMQSPIMKMGASRPL